MSVTINGTTGLAGVDGSAGTPAVQGSDTNTGIFFPAADTVGVTTGGSERVRVDSSGNVGINTTTMTRNFNIGGSGAAVGMNMNNTGTSGRSYSIFSTNSSASVVGALGFYDDTASSYRMVIDSSGNLLVGTTANAITAYTASKSLVQSADYSGAVAQLINSTSTTGTQYFLAFGRGASVCGQITSGATNSTTYATSSDYRLKKDVQPMKGALAKVQALKPCTYKWIEDDTTSEGFIAHELAEVCPDAVVGEKDAVNAEGNPVYQGVDTSFLVATLTAAIQEQQALITALTARVTALEAKP